MCMRDHVTNNMGGVVSVECSGDGLYVGYEKMRCVLDEKDGE